MKLFRVSFKDFDSVYVEAKSYDMAIVKAEKYRKFDKGVNTIVDAEGFLRREDDDQVQEVKVISEFVVR